MTITRTLLLASAALLALMPPAAQSAEIKGYQYDANIYVITVEGTLEYGDEKAFDRLAPTSHTVVAFNSAGGNMVAGLSIGSSIREKSYDTLVTDGAICASSCAFAWLGGAHRMMDAGAKIGFHQVYQPNQTIPDAQAMALVGAYMGKLGLPWNAIYWLNGAAPDDMRWITIAEAGAYGIPVYSPPETKPASPAPKAPVQPVARPDVAVTHWDLNGSTMELQQQGIYRRFVYVQPRTTLPKMVVPGTVLFDGTKETRWYSGTGYVFPSKCGAQAYQMTGTISSDANTITLHGKSPKLNERCQITAYRDSIDVFTRISE